MKRASGPCASCPPDQRTPRRALLVAADRDSYFREPVAHVAIGTLRPRYVGVGDLHGISCRASSAVERKRPTCSAFYSPVMWT
jgi:hypothetical protein